MSDEKIIEIKIKETESKYIVSVADSGQGIPLSIIDKIFDPFYTSKDVNKGTGIGLSLCHRIITEHDSELIVDTKEGVGTTFSFNFNKVIGKVDTATSLNESEELRKPTAKLTGHILIVDDEIEVRKLLEIFVADIGLTSESVENGKEALEFYLKEPRKYDYIISDIQMPVMDVKTLFKEIRSNNKLHQPKLLMVTGGVNINFEEKDSEMGKLIDGYFTKPFNMETIQQTLEDL